jgi:lipopolysaccharide export system permease protein
LEYREKVRVSVLDSLKRPETVPAVSLISRYVLRETIGAWFVVLAVLLVIFMSNQFAETLGDAAADNLPRDAVFSIFGLTSMQYLTMLTPMALFLGVILALARLNRDSEMAALSACGVGPGRLLRPIGVLTVLLAAGVGWLALHKTPDATRQIEQIKLEAREAMRLDVLEPGRFTTPDSGDTVLYPRRVSGDRIYDVFIQRQSEEGVVTILAERGERVRNVKTGELSFVLFDGRRYEGVPGQKEFLVIEFEEHGIPVRGGDEEGPAELVASKATSDLLASVDPEARAELQWRLASPISLFVLAALAVALSRSTPREGRYARIGVALLFYVSYVNLLSIARVWMEREVAPVWLGLWWVHAVFGLFALLILGRDAGWFVRTPRPAGVVAP